MKRSVHKLETMKHRIEGCRVLEGLRRRNKGGKIKIDTGFNV